MAKILIIGSVAWDEVVRLDEPLRVGSHNGGHGLGRRIGGGAANTAMALARAGVPVDVVSAVGEGEEGSQLLAELERIGVGVSRIDRHAGETTRSLILLDESGERTVVNLARASLVVPDELANLNADCIYVRSGETVLTRLLQQRVRNTLVVAHVPPVRQGFRPAQVLVGSASDLDEAFLADPFDAGRRVAGEHMQWMVITHGKGGAVAHGREHTIEVAAPVVEVIDSTGAGDVFAGGLAHALAEGAQMEQALKTAVAWGSASVVYEGTIPPAGFPAVGQSEQ